jgi:tetratricopeptide (TPR) repeat protein
MSAAERPIAVAPGLDTSNPYPGLLAFAELDRAYFHGRARERDELFRLVRREVLTVLFGRSGLGKTSLLNAGLYPLLRQADILPISIRLDFTAGKGDLASQVRAVCAAALRMQRVDARPPAASETLWEYFHQTQFWSPRNQLLTPLLVFDQFEEIFTLGRRDARVEPLVAELADLVENHMPSSVRERLAETHEELAFSYERQKVRIVFSLREDFLPQLEGLRPRIPSLARNRYRLLHLDGNQALEAILKPVGGLVSDESAREILRVVAIASREDRAGEPGATPAVAEDLAEMEVEPALLSLFCRELNNRRQRRGLAAITVELVQGTHGEILAAFYDQCLAGMAHPVRTLVEERLLTSSGFRQSLPLEEALLAKGVAAEDLGRLVDRRLLRIEDRLGRRHVELIHDVMTPVIRESRDRRHARAVHRRLLGRAALLLAFIAASVVFLVRESRLEAARRYRSKAQELVGYMLANLHNELDTKAKRDVFRQAASGTLVYLDALQRSDSTEDPKKLRSTALKALGDLDREEGKDGAAERSYLKALAIGRALLAKDPMDRWSQDLLAAVLQDLSPLLDSRGDLQGARERFSEALCLREEMVLNASSKERSSSHATYAEAVGKFADLLLSHQHMSTAVRAYGAVVRDLEEMTKDRAMPELDATLALAYRRQGQILHESGDSPAALKSLRSALEIQERLARERPDDPIADLELSLSQELTAETALSAGDSSRGLAMADSAASLARPHRSQAAAGRAYSLVMATTGIIVGDVLLARRDLDGALHRYQGARALVAKQAKRGPGEVDFTPTLSLANSRTGNAHARRGELALARQDWGTALAIISPRVKKDDSDNSEILDVYVRPLLELGRLDEARPVCIKLRDREWNYLGLQKRCRDKGLLPS